MTAGISLRMHFCFTNCWVVFNVFLLAIFLENSTIFCSLSKQKNSGVFFREIVFCENLQKFCSIFCFHCLKFNKPREIINSNQYNFDFIAFTSYFVHKSQFLASKNIDITWKSLKSSETSHRGSNFVNEVLVYKNCSTFFSMSPLLYSRFAQNRTPFYH